jgi:hypothetical protein
MTRASPRQRRKAGNRSRSITAITIIITTTTITAITALSRCLTGIVITTITTTIIITAASAFIFVRKHRGGRHSLGLALVPGRDQALASSSTCASVARRAAAFFSAASRR